jgi:hypothetical protein
MAKALSISIHNLSSKQTLPQLVRNPSSKWDEKDRRFISNLEIGTITAMAGDPMWYNEA